MQFLINGGHYEVIGKKQKLMETFINIQIGLDKKTSLGLNLETLYILRICIKRLTNRT